MSPEKSAVPVTNYEQLTTTNILAGKFFPKALRSGSNSDEKEWDASIPKLLAEVLVWPDLSR